MIHRDKFKAMGGRLCFLLQPPLNGHYRTSIEFNLIAQSVVSYRDVFYIHNLEEAEQIIYVF